MIRKISCSILLFLAATFVYSQKTIELAGKKFTIKGELLCAYTDDSFSEAVEMECYIDLTKDSIFYYEVGYQDGKPSILNVDKVALKDLSPEESPFIFDSQFRQKGKIFYELHVFTKDFQDLVIHLHQTKYSNGKDMFGLINICFKTEDEAKKYNEKLRLLVK